MSSRLHDETAGRDSEVPIISARDLRVSLDEKEILHGLTFDVGSGRFVGLLGPNGSGKTTLLRATGGLLPYRGDLDFEGTSMRDWKPRLLARRVAFVRQSVALSFDFSVSELILLGRSPHKRWLEDYAEGDRQQMREALAQTDLIGFEDRSVLSLSGGELQRVFLAQALVQEADVLLLDEPTAHLDVHYQFEFMDLVRSLVAGGRTAIAVFHDLEMAARYAGDVLVLREGRIAAAGPPAEVLSEELIARVFRMDARIETNGGNPVRIHYVRPIARQAV
ncbi:MAG: ABC transporter ATP-binding protein [Rhodothermales bacterium]